MYSERKDNKTRVYFHNLNFIQVISQFSILCYKNHVNMEVKNNAKIKENETSILFASKEEMNMYEVKTLGTE